MIEVVPALSKAYWEKDEQEREKGAAEAIECVSLLLKEPKDKKFFGGETVGLADIAALFLGFWLVTLQEAGGAKLLRDKLFAYLKTQLEATIA